MLSDNNYGGFLQTVTYYDSKGRVIQVHRQLYELGGESREQVSYKHDFAGNILEERSTQWTSSGKYRIDKNFTYDHQNRLTSTTHTIYENDTQKKTYTHAANTYNNIGLLSAKDLHNGIQKLNYKYTPRGWLNILQNNGGKSFRVELGYNSNGNISNLSWQTNGYSGNFNSIGYDGSNRLNYANGSPLQENGITYDKNGNIKALNRTGAATDQLDYSSYDGNRLSTIKDNSNDNTGVKGGTSTFSYDSNGNMTSDGTKGAAVAYNLLNLPREVTMTSPNRTLQYFYDGGGSKLKMNAPGVSTLYAGAFEYTSNGTLLRVGLEEGQLIRNSAGSYEVNYYLRDHLGNVRQVLKEDGNVLQETEYYPFGLAIPRTAGTNKYTFLGKEKQPETNWIDLQARFFDPTIGRFMVIDPETEGQLEYSPYHYSFNNPILFSDPDGRFPFLIPLIPAIAGVVEAGITGATVATAVYGIAVLVQKGIDAGGSSAYSPATGMAMSLSTPGEITSGYRNASGSKTETTDGNKNKSSTDTKTYQTYTKPAKDPNEKPYSGKTSGKGTPEENVAKRDKNHHKNDKYGPAELDKSSKNSDAIRGREQQLINQNGGAQSQGGNSGNAINSVSPNNGKRDRYEKAANDSSNFN